MRSASSVSSTKQRFFTGLLGGVLIAGFTGTTGTVWAEYSPLSSVTQGEGLPMSPEGAREQGMGEAGMAALSPDGYFLPNISRTAFADYTSFSTTLQTDMDVLRDNSSSTHVATLSIPSIATFIKTPKLGTFGAYYQQTYQRNFAVLRDTANLQEEYEAKGGLYVLGVSWAYAPVSFFAFGVSYNFVIGHDRFIQQANVVSSDTSFENTEGLQDTSEISGLGSYPTFSGTFRTRRFDFALSFTPAVNLDAKQQQTITGIVADSLPDTTRALPMSVSSGVAWNISARQTAALDVYYEDWKTSSQGMNELNPAYQVAMGYEFRGLANPFVDYHKRVTYRGGLGYDLLYLQKTPEYYGTFGMGFPLGIRGHELDISLKYAHRNASEGPYFAEDYVNISATLIGVGNWGQPARKHH